MRRFNRLCDRLISPAADAWFWLMFKADGINTPFRLESW